MNYAYIKNKKSSDLRKKRIVVMLVLATVPTLLAYSQFKAYADQYDDKINALKNEIGQYQSQAASLQTQAATLKDAIANLDGQKVAIQKQIDTSQAQYDEMQKKINDLKVKIKTNQDYLGQIIANMYVNDRITPIEMLASSKNISDFLDKSAYNASARDKLLSTITEIKSMKADLDKQNVAIERVLVDSKNERQNLSDKEQEQQSLLAQTNGQEQAYQTMIRDKQAQTTKLIAEQVSLNQQAALRSNSQVLESGTVGGGGYPGVWANAPRDTLVDSWGLYNRECVSYTAWKVASTGRFVPNFNGYGNARQWEGYLAQYGIKAGDTPVVGSVAVLNIGTYGHTMYVEAVSDDKSRITVSEYNYNWSGLYSKRSISSAGLRYIYF